MHNVTNIQVKNPVILLFDSQNSFDIVLKGAEIGSFFAILSSCVVVGTFI